MVDSASLRVLVTGGAGFIGSHVVEMLALRGHQVTAIDDLSAGRRHNLPRGTKFVEKKVSNLSYNDLAGFDWVIHLAAQVSTFRSVDFPALDFRSNARSTFHLIEGLRKYNDYAKVIFVSSRSVLGDIPEGEIATDETRYNPASLYAAHKAYGELLCQVYSRLYGMRFAVLRPSNVYGPRQPYWKGGSYDFIAFWLNMALEGKSIRP